jgi:predicted nicotinamide N-methyase
MDAQLFIRQNTALIAPPLLPEIKLHLAHEALPLWEKTEEELGQIGLPPPFWAFAWAGGQALARYVLDHPEAVAGRKILDFAAGSGLLAIAAMRAGAAEVLYRGSALQHTVVIRVRPDPEPHDVIALDRSQCAITNAEANGPQATNPLQVEGGVPRIILQELEVTVGQASDVLRQPITGTPELRSRKMPHRALVRQAR